MIAALYVQTNGCYYGLDGVDPWDQARDARKYSGPWPVVAHPPCQLWVNLAAVNFKRYGGEHNRPTCEVWQSAYGHKARKRTWLYYCGLRPFELNWSRDPGTHQIGWFDRNKPTLSKKEASATPPAFRDVLLDLARGPAHREAIAC